MGAMQVATKFLRLTKPAALGDRSMAGGSAGSAAGTDAGVLFVVMVEKPVPRFPSPIWTRER